MFGKLSGLFFIITSITMLVVIVSIGSQGQLQSVDESCAPLAEQHPYHGYITVHNTTSGDTANYSKGTFCNYQLNYYYDWGLSWMAPMISAIITAVFAIIYFGWESKLEEDLINNTTDNFNVSTSSHGILPKLDTKDENNLDDKSNNDTYK